jgi:uncharacterized membrane protein YtjA (UPF0391 family)
MPADQGPSYSFYIDGRHYLENAMLKWALIFALIALVAGLLGFTGIAAGAAGIAKFLFVLFLVLFLVVVSLALLGIGALKK